MLYYIIAYYVICYYIIVDHVILYYIIFSVLYYILYYIISCFSADRSPTDEGNEFGRGKTTKKYIRKESYQSTTENHLFKDCFSSLAPLWIDSTSPAPHIYIYIYIRKESCQSTTEEISYYVMLCYVMLYYIILYYII